MRIFLDCRALQKEGPGNERTRFILSCVAGLVDHHGIEWLFLLDGKRADLPLPAGERIVAGRSFWLIARTARKHNADIIMTTDGRKVRSSILQCTWMPGGAVLRLPSGADVTVPAAPDETAAPLSPDERERVKEKIAEGKEYFLSDVNGARVQEIVHLLKAFSLFKRRQLSNMKLVLTGRVDREIIEKLDSYKYRQDVCINPGTGMEEPGWRLDVVGGAYAVIHLARRDSLGLDVLNAWKAGVPVITDQAGNGDPVLRVAPGDPAPLADALKTLYKDEAFRSELIGKAALGAAGLSLRQSVATIWEAIGRN